MSDLQSFVDKVAYIGIFSFKIHFNTDLQPLGTALRFAALQHFRCSAFHLTIPLINCYLSNNISILAKMHEGLFYHVMREGLTLLRLGLLINDMVTVTVEESMHLIYPFTPPA